MRLVRSFQFALGMWRPRFDQSQYIDRLQLPKNGVIASAIPPNTISCAARHLQSHAEACVADSHHVVF